MKTLYLIIPFAPLAGAIIAGLFGKAIGRAGAHWVTILSVLVSFVCSCVVFADVLNGNTFNGPVYTWITMGDTPISIGFLVDRLSALMMVVVTFVSLMVHIYTIGYMADDPGYQRFFSYISLFTFSMLMLVMSNNFLQLFFGWEAVGLVSYLLIGFWFKKPSAIFANLKAFLVNRVGDFGFLLGIAGVLYIFQTLDYRTVFDHADVLTGKSIRAVAAEWNAQGLKTTLAGTTQKRDGKEHLVAGTWNSPRVRRLLINPRYAGLKVHRGKVIGKGDWTPLIAVDTHRGLVAYLSDPARIICTSFVRKYLGSGVYVCGRCGGPIAFRARNDGHHRAHQENTPHAFPFTRFTHASHAH